MPTRATQHSGEFVSRFLVETERVQSISQPVRQITVFHWTTCILVWCL